VDDAPHTSDLDLSPVETWDELLVLLRQVHLRADRPSLRTLEARARRGRTPLSKSAAAEMLKGTRLPHKAVMVAFLRACGIPDDGLDQWQRAWERVATGQEATRFELRQAVARPQGEATALAGDLTGTTAHDDSQLRRVSADQAPSGSTASHQPMWEFPDGSRIVLVSLRLPEDRRPPSANPKNLNYVRLAELADLDTVIDIHGAVRAHNPASQVVITAAQDLTQHDVANHLVLIGGYAWEEVASWFSRIFPMPVVFWDPLEHGAIKVRLPEGGEREFKHTLIGEEIVEDVGFLAFGKNPSAPRRKLIVCGGITTRGVHGAALCFIDMEMREGNERYLRSRFSGDATSCVVMRVPIMNNDPLTPDLSKPENRLFEWSSSETGAD
jgi:hypothetical protein